MDRDRTRESDQRLRAPAPRQPIRERSAASRDDALVLASAVGNRTFSRIVAGSLQRQPLVAADTGAKLTSWRLAGDPDLDAAFHNVKFLMSGSSGPGVARFQHALIDAGYVMPATVQSGMPDKKYGSDTTQAVVRFQKHEKLHVDGVAGHETLGRLDAIAAGGPARGPEIDATDSAIGKYVADGMARANTGYSSTTGIYYDYNYFAEHQKDPTNYPWNDDWRSGLAPPEYFTKVGWMDWKLKPGKSAAAGIRAWLTGLTIAECLTTITAIEIDALRAAIGDDAFDARFGSERVIVPEHDRLRIHQGTKGTPAERKLKAASGSLGPFGSRNLQQGQWVYFYNHPKYLLKHPGGAWQGENAVFMGVNKAGKQIFSGLGATDMTEDAMVDEMVSAYNGARDGADYVWLLQTFAPNAPEVQHPSREFLDHDDAYTLSLYEKYKDKVPAQYREDGGEFKDTVTRDEILNDDPYTLNGTTRKGGIVPDAIEQLDTDVVEQLRPVP